MLHMGSFITLVELLPTQNVFVIMPQRNLKVKKLMTDRAMARGRTFILSKAPWHGVRFPRSLSALRRNGKILLMIVMRLSWMMRYPTLLLCDLIVHLWEDCRGRQFMAACWKLSFTVDGISLESSVSPL